MDFNVVFLEAEYPMNGNTNFCIRLKFIYLKPFSITRSGDLITKLLILLLSKAVLFISFVVDGILTSINSELFANA